MFGIIPDVDSTSGTLYAVFRCSNHIKSSFKSAYFWSFSVMVLWKLWLSGIVASVKYASVIVLWSTECLKYHYLFWKVMIIKKNGFKVWKIYLFQSKFAHLHNLYIFNSRPISLMMDVEERVFVVTCKIKGMKCEKIRDNFEREFHKKGPTDKAIRGILTKFQRTGSVHDGSRNGRPIKSEERMELVREAFEEDPQLSTRRASNVSEIPWVSIRRILWCDLKKIPTTFRCFTTCKKKIIHA